MDIILRPFAWLLLLFYNVVQNYGVALILFAILVKVILFPLSLKGKKSMIQMNMLSGKMQKLQKQYGKDQARYNQELQKLYEKEHVSPFGGCLWSFIPLLILIPLYSVIRQPMKYMMSLSADQIAKVAETLNWSTVALEKGWIKEAAAYTGGAYNELFLSSLITDSNLNAVQAAANSVAEGGKVLAMHFNFLGMDLSQVPQLKFWEGGNWSSVGLFLLVVVSALTGLVFSRITQKTNNLNNQEQNEQTARTNKMMMWMTPLMSLWIGFVMPGLLCVYWIANNVLSMVQEIICGRMLKGDYEAAAKAQAEAAAREKEEEKERRRKAAERRAKELEEAKKNKKKLPKKPGTPQDRSAAEASRVGIRTYARGRAYDPDRFGGVTPYRDPSAPVDEAAIEAALAAREEEKEAAAAETEVVEAAEAVDQTTTPAETEPAEEPTEAEPSPEEPAAEETAAAEETEDEKE